MNVSDFVRGLIGQKRGLCRMEMIKSQHLSSACKPEKKKNCGGDIICLDAQRKEKKKKKRTSWSMWWTEAGCQSSPLLPGWIICGFTGGQTGWCCCPSGQLPHFYLNTTERRSSWCYTSPHHPTVKASLLLDSNEWMDGWMNEWMECLPLQWMNGWLYRGHLFRVTGCSTVPPPCLMAVN